MGSQTSAVTDFDTQVASGAVIADPIVSVIQDGTLLDVNVLGTGSRGIRRDERKTIVHVLKTVTGVSYGDDYLLWKEWWNNNRQEILGAKTAKAKKS